QTDSAPFTRELDGSVTYSGDSGQREAQISDNVKVAINHDGELVFGGVPNPRGDFTVDYQLGGGARETSVTVESAKITDRGSFTDAHPYNIKFVESTPPEPGKVSYTITDGNG